MSGRPFPWTPVIIVAMFLGIVAMIAIEKVW